MLATIKKPKKAATIAQRKHKTKFAFAASPTLEI